MTADGWEVDQQYAKMLIGALCLEQNAYDYLTKLHSKYDDWLLAIAAYNAGPNRISKEIKKNRAKGLSIDFWSLNLPKETKAYVPKLLALIEVIKNPKEFNVVIPNLPNRPYFQLVTLPSQVDLMQVANISGLKLEVIYAVSYTHLTLPTSDLV